MSPRIQVYKAIACRSLMEEQDRNGLGLAALLLQPQCGDAEVQARAAKIQASVVTTMSVLSAVTTGFWSRLGDKIGRKPIFAAFFLGALFMEAFFVLVMMPDSLWGRYGEKWILAGPIIEGLVGGLSVFNGVVHAYVSDCTRHGSRSKIFSTVQGMVFVGLASGPWFSGLILPKTGYSHSFFYWSVGLISFNFFYILLVCPESLVVEDEDSTSRSGTTPLAMEDTKSSSWNALQQKVVSLTKAVLLPLFMFAPKRPRGSSKRSWIMVFPGLALLLYLVSTGVFSAKYLYAQHVFDWTTAELGYYMSILWITRAFNLLVFLPILISYFKPKPTSTDDVPNAHDIAAELNFDRYLAQISLGVDGLADSLVAITSSRSQPIFVMLSCMSSFTSGGNPALHSLGAVCLHACGHSSEAGSLFGAMAVLSAVAHIISPWLYALTYSKTVASYPEGIFVLAACLLFSAVLLLSRVKPDVDEIAVAHSRTPGERAAMATSNYDYEAISTADDDIDEDERRREHERGVSSASVIDHPH